MAEVEFLIEREGQAIPVEVKSGSITKAKSLKVFKEKYRPKSQIILSAKPLQNDATNQYYPLYLAGKILKNFTAKEIYKTLLL